ncbi:uncharacterized protein LOC135107372 [Scylla paramamosain]|uniref:uncharacterized protein LOC135107372 n=1 Tax=Scylla paramamosain TaxID=85552 RepID=UPI0030833E58
MRHIYQRTKITVHIDIVGPLPPATLPNYSYPLPYSYLLTCIDRATRWREAIPVIDTNASSVAIAFVAGWISHFGVPLQVVTDRGAQFESELFSELSSIIGFHHMRTTAYHPQANGIIERHHRSLKSAIRARQENWFYALPIVLLGYRLTPNMTSYSPFTAVTGTHMLCPSAIITKDSPISTNKDTIHRLIKEMQAIDFYNFSSGECHSSSKPYVPNVLFSCSKVWVRIDRVRKSLEAPYSGPYEVIQRDPKYFILRLPQGDTSVSIECLKPAYIPITRQAPSNDRDDLTTSTLDSNSSPFPDISASTPSPSAHFQSDLPRHTIPNFPRTTRSGKTVYFNQHPHYLYY